MSASPAWTDAIRADLDNGSNWSDLTVMGAYGHGLIREMITGSTTTQIIATSDRPVLLVR